MKEQTERSYLLDNCKFFLILLVVVGHGLELLSGRGVALWYQLIYLFHMPAFVFVSGYSAKLSSKPKIGDIFLYYALFQVLYSLFANYVLGQQSPFKLFQPYWILWFLLALIVWRVLLPFTARNKIVFALSIVAAVLVGLDNEFGYYFTLSRVVVLFPFFWAGNYLQEKHILRLRARVHPAIAAGVFGLSFALLYALPLPTKQLLYHSVSYEKMSLAPPQGILWRSAVLLWAAVLVAAFFCLIPAKKAVYSHLGGRTMQVYVLHGFAMRYLQHIGIGAQLTSPFGKVAFIVILLAGALLLLTKPFSLLFKPVTALACFVGKAQEPA